MDKNFNDEFGDDLFGRWQEFNRMMNESSFFKEDLLELFKILLSSREFNQPIDFRILPLNMMKKEDIEDFNIPEDDIEIEKGRDEQGEWETKKWVSPDGSISWSSFSRSSTPEDFISEYKNRKAKKYSGEDFKTLKIQKLQKALNSAVNVEDYEKAAELKKEIDKLKEENFENK